MTSNNDNNDNIEHNINNNVYHVQVIETDASIRCGLKPFIIYHLIIESTKLKLKINHKYLPQDEQQQQQPEDNQSSSILFEWPYKHLRRYGYTSNSISFEAGSKSVTGEGLFIFRNKKSKILYNQINDYIEMIKRNSSGSSSKSNVNDNKAKINDNQLLINYNNDNEQSIVNHQSIKHHHHHHHHVVPHLIINGCPYALIIKK